MVRSPKADEDFTKDDGHSYENIEVPESHDHPPPETSAAVIYDKLLATDSDKAQAQEPPLAEPAHEYDEPRLISSPTMATSGASSSTQSQPHSLQSNKEDSGDDDNRAVYINIPDELDQEDLYTEIDQTDPPAPSEGATFPEELDSIDEDNLNPNEMQLWLLLQMQKMVQKMEDVYGACKPSSPRPAKRQADTIPRYAKVQHGKTKAPSPPSSPDPPPKAVKQTNNEDTESEPTRQDLYENPDNINEAIKETFPPPIPPRKYQVIDGSKAPPAPPAPPSSRSPDQRPHQSNTLPSHASQSAARPKPPPVQPKSIHVCQHQSKFLSAGKKYNMLFSCIFST